MTQYQNLSVKMLDAFRGQSFLTGFLLWIKWLYSGVDTVPKLGYKGGEQ